jgi:FK506-binding protein 14
MKLLTNSCFLAATLLATASAATELTVTQTDGPTECEDSERVAVRSYVSMHYIGSIDESSETGEKGKQFHNSKDNGQTYDFQIGTKRVIPGWDAGLMGLCKGAKVTLVIPPDMGYGAQGADGDIPGGATLHFEVEVVDVADKAPLSAPQPNFFKLIDTDEDGTLNVDEIALYFKSKGMEVPEGLWPSEDKDGDGIISWDEFTGPKGDQDPAKAEL